MQGRGGGVDNIITSGKINVPEHKTQKQVYTNNFISDKSSISTDEISVCYQN